MRLYITIIIGAMLMILSPKVFSQRFIEKGDEAYGNEYFIVAIDNYKKHIEKNRKGSEANALAEYKLGDCYMMLSRPKEACLYYGNALRNGYDEDTLYYKLSEAFLQHEEFDSAIYVLEQLKAKSPSDARIDVSIDRIHDITKQLENPNDYVVKIFALANSGELDFCPFFGYKDFEKLFFTSSRTLLDKPEVNLQSGDRYTDIYETERNNRTGEWSIPRKSYGPINTEFDEGVASLNRRYNVLYFTRCENIPGSSKGCKIYRAKRRSKHWSSVEEVKIPGVPEELSIGHPSISDDELILYFVADSMLGGYGGKDIYKVTRERKSQDFGAPQNLGPDINTVKDECFPYVRKDGTLYFSSSAHQSIGGLDIFVTEKKGPSSYVITSLGSPINSPADDFGIVFKDSIEEGYFTSQRRGGVGKSDIYSFCLPDSVHTITGLVWDKTKNIVLENVEIKLMDSTGRVMDQLKTNKKGEYRLNVKEGTSYTLLFMKEPYLPIDITIRYDDFNETNSIRREVFLNKM